MNRTVIFITVVFLSSCQLFEKESKPKEVYGCMDSTAMNYNPDANIDDGSCNYCQEGASFILVSKDSGINWSLTCLSDSIGQVIDIALIDTNNIWLCTYANNDIPNAQLLFTNDGGKTWEEQISYDNTILGQISFEYLEMFDLNNGIALANDWTNYIPMFLKTTDGGKNWIQTTTAPIGISGDIWRRVDFVDINTGFLFESLVNPQKLLKTTDSGLTWQDTNFDDYAYVLKFYDENLGVVAGDEGVQRTKDGGASWQKIQNINTIWASDIEFDRNDPSKVWLLSDSLYFSSDTGSSWIGCFDNSLNASIALKWSNSNLWVYNQGRYLRKVDVDNCLNYIDIQLPEYPYGDLILGNDFDVMGDVLVIPGMLR